MAHGMLGGNGIHALILGREQMGIQAFSEKKGSFPSIDKLRVDRAAPELNPNSKPAQAGLLFQQAISPLSLDGCPVRELATEQ